jgi:hypothetical protein
MTDAWSRQDIQHVLGGRGGTGHLVAVNFTVVREGQQRLHRHGVDGIRDDRFCHVRGVEYSLTPVWR